MGEKVWPVLDGVPVEVGIKVGDWLGVAEEVGVDEGEGEREPLAVGVIEGVRLGVRVWVGLAVNEGVPLGVPDGVSDGVEVAEGTSVGVLLAVEVREAEGVGVGNATTGSDTRRTRELPVSPIIRNALLESTATHLGLVKRALVPLPSAKPLVDSEPASELTAPAGVMARMQWLENSVTYTMLLPSTAMPEGLLKAAFVPTPLVSAGVPEPAKVLTKPAGETALMRWLVWSVTRAVPSTRRAMPLGLANCARVPAPFAKPEVVCPASVLTIIAGEMTRMSWLLRSVKYTLPSALTATLDT